jgi:hypothetical protein
MGENKGILVHASSLSIGVRVIHKQRSLVLVLILNQHRLGQINASPRLEIHHSFAGDFVELFLGIDIRLGCRKKTKGFVASPSRVVEFEGPGRLDAGRGIELGNEGVAFFRCSFDTFQGNISVAEQRQNTFTLPKMLMRHSVERSINVPRPQPLQVLQQALEHQDYLVPEPGCRFGFV